MKIKHIHCDELYRAYAAQVMEVDDELAVLIASEEAGYPGYMYRGENFEHRELLWEKGGGCMSIIPIPNKKNEFLAVMDFYLKVSPSQSKIVWGKYHKDTGWVIHDVMFLPYLHRFDIYPIEGKNIVVCATIADDKQYKDDWSLPGSIYSGELPEDPRDGIKLSMIETGFYRNHGYFRKETLDGPLGYFTSDQGIITLNHGKKDWKIEKIMDSMISEVAVMDLNGDGVDELITIEPFHGNTIKVYEAKDGAYEAVYTFPGELDFGHALVCADLFGKPAFVGGIRRVNCELFTITYENGQYSLNVIDHGGPANLAVGYRGDQVIIAAANHTRNEAAVYILENES